MAELLEVERLRVRFRALSPLSARLAGVRDPMIDAVADVSLSIPAGGAFGLVGESGSGKTTLGRAIMGLVSVWSGEIRLSGEAFPKQGGQALKTWRRHIAMTFQDPTGSLSPRLTVRALITEPLRIHGLADRDHAAEARRLISLVGLSTDFLDRYPHELSGGQARRVGIARALALAPRLLIADEPTAGLDVSVQGEVLNLLTRLRGELGIALLLITHNLAAVRLSAEQLGVMYMGRLVETGPPTAVFRGVAHPYTAALLAAIPVADPTRQRERAIVGEVPSLLNRPAGCEFHTRCPHAEVRCRAEAPEPRTVAPDHVVRCHFPLDAVGKR
ncbi:MAG TPA: ABC transporter ATP-binding protein [Stellaceae bacterium]|nr:ABC transporter ATP-binding protein [Stellaceae bacterium]